MVQAASEENVSTPKKKLMKVATNLLPKKKKQSKRMTALAKSKLASKPKSKPEAKAKPVKRAKATSDAKCTMLLRLPKSIKAPLKSLAQQKGVSTHSFVLNLLVASVTQS